MPVPASGKRRLTDAAHACSQPAVAIAAATQHCRNLLQGGGKQRFPPYACETNPANSPFRLEGAYTTTPSPNGQRVCIRGAAVQPCPPGNPCCSKADFYKLELRVSECQPSASRPAYQSLLTKGGLACDAAAAEQST